MAGVRALPDLVARIVLNTTGLKAAAVEAQAAGAYMSGGLAKAEKASVGLGGSLAGLNLPLLAAGIAATGLVMAGKSMLDIAEKWETAHRGLEQATKAMGASYQNADRFINTFIGSNKRYVQSQSEVVDSYAELTRSGLKEKEVQRDLNIALDLAALKHISLAEATGLVNKAEHGRMRGLIDLGIVTKDQTDADGNLIAGTKGIAAAMDALEKKTEGGRDSTTQLTQAQNQLGNTWQSISNKVGPVLVTALTDILIAFNAIADAIGFVIGKVADLILWFSSLNSAAANTAAKTNEAAGAQGIMTGRFAHPTTHRASGGPVVPGGIYTIGERGPETLVMGASGGTVIPNGGRGSSGGVTLVVQGFVGNPNQLFQVFREGIRRLDMGQKNGAGA